LGLAVLLCCVTAAIYFSVASSAATDVSLEAAPRLLETIGLNQSVAGVTEIPLTTKHIVYAKSRCAEFKAIYDGLSNQQYVNKLFETTGIIPVASDRARTRYWVERRIFDASERPAKGGGWNQCDRGK